MPRRVNTKEDAYVLSRVSHIIAELKKSPERRNEFLLFAGSCGGDVFALGDRLKKTFSMKASTITPFLALTLLDFVDKKPAQKKS